MTDAFDPAPDAESLYFLPLGGTGEIGMNLNLYGHDGQWLMVDLGITFPEDSSLPGVEVLMPDPGFIEVRRGHLIGLVLTHGHEDHIGAVPYLWPRLRCPVYATPFTAELLRRKLADAGLLEEVPLHEIPLSGHVRLGSFDIELISLTHSIPEPNALAIRTSVGTVLHTGDWKIDPDPLIGDNFDEGALRALAREGVLALVGDSTNAMVEGRSGSEAEVRENLARLVRRAEGRVLVACFATNVARLESAMVAARRANRRVCLLGRSMQRIYEAATLTGYLNSPAQLISERHVGYLPREEVMILATGSQGEPRAALPRLSRGEHRHIALESGDTVIFSSRVIPGNERPIRRLQERLRSMGAKVLTDGEVFVHVSGHPAREELTQMYRWIRPKIAVPVHGEPQHLRAHGQLAESCQVPQSLVGLNGRMIRLAPGPKAEIVAEVESGRLALDGNRLLPLDASAFKERNRIAQGGIVLATLVIDHRGTLLVPPRITQPGLGDEDLAEDWLVNAVKTSYGQTGRAVRRDQERLRETLRIALRRAVQKKLNKKVPVEVHVVRV
ncbi:MAG: ribonuclease J [Rhodospirillales bacterium]|nr:ribonuclease J [Rhodospirillales bacterium]